MPASISPFPSLSTASITVRTSFLMISISSWRRGLITARWSASMFTTWRVAFNPAALASFVGMPRASCGVFTMTFVAPDRAATVEPQQMTENAFDSSSGKPPIHWWKTVVRS
ncbi:MAG: hypothetical protein BWY66_02214 [bacterium ADurb.Bin374]|nr:MAG: hypothetical protein BWY66_02214 [bacterium ADurb.Bin374]